MRHDISARYLARRTGGTPYDGTRFDAESGRGRDAIECQRIALWRFGVRTDEQVYGVTPGSQCCTRFHYVHTRRAI